MLNILKQVYTRLVSLFTTNHKQNGVMVHHKLLFVTGLLVLLLHSGHGLYASFVVFTITVITAYICYTLNTQLRLDGFFKFLIYFGIGAPKPLASRDEADNSLQLKHQDLDTYPKPIRDIIHRFIDSIVRDFVKSWYVFIGPDEEDFIVEVKQALEYAIAEVAMHLEKADIHSAVINLIRMFQRHVKVFDDYRAIIQCKYPGISDEDFGNCITELYEAGINKHIATRSKGTELDYLKTLLDILLYQFLPKDVFSCEGGHFMLREILAVQLLEPLLDQFTQAHFVNQIIIDILEPSIQLSVVIQEYEDAMNETVLEIDDALSVDSVEELSGNETNYESSPEDYKSVANLRESFQSITKNHTSKDSNSEFADCDNENELLRFDNFDRTRTSAPVYGSKSARDHEKSKHKKSKPISENVNSSNIYEKIDVANDEILVDSGRVSKHSLSINGDHFSENEDEFSLPNRESDEPWNSCPPASSDVFRKSSFNSMPRHQDKIHEQLKAKMKQIPLPSSCIRCGSNVNKQHRCTKSVDGSVTMEFSKKQNSQDQLPSAIPSTTASSDTSNAVVKIHDSGKTGVFYEVAPTCPTCIEMTLLASPFENGKARLVLTPEEQKNKDKHKVVRVEPHECGLDGEHYFYAETDNELMNYEPLDDVSFESCAGDINDLSTSFSSGTLLASGETCATSDKEEIENKGMESYDILSLQSQDSINSENSSVNSLSYDDLDIEGTPQPKMRKRLRRRTLSNRTFKTAIEGSVLSENDIVINKGKIKKTRKSNKLFKFFKSGFPSYLDHQKSTSVAKRKHRKSTSGGKSKKKNKLAKAACFEDGVPVNETSSISTSVTKFNSIPESSLPSHANRTRQDSFVGSFIEEVGLEVDEDEEFLDHLKDDEYLEEFEDAPSQIYSSSLHNIVLPVDPLTKVIKVTEKDLHVEARSTKSHESAEKSKEGRDFLDATFIPIFKGEVIMPHPSKIPAAWLYPIQMVSIPTTELAYEKGWEPGINKYTLYSIHYDIRIWPDLYKKQIEVQRDDHETKDDIPVIREIKRRYREFLYLHNRLTHGHLSKHMKGILRPNRRYAMPFGRMDPDVIEGRRKILETYLVSLVSRPELCNSREFKDFLGSEGSDDPFEMKPKKITQKKIYKQKVNKVLTGGDQHNGHKENVFQRGLHSQYFIHGYEIPRMFGYCSDDDVSRHSLPFIKSFTDDYPILRKSFAKKKSHRANVVAAYEPIQRPVFYILNEPTDWPPGLGPRTAGDGAEKPDESFRESGRSVTFDATVKYHDGKINLNESQQSFSIAAKFSEELASQLLKEKDNASFEVKREKDLYESSWPLTDAVLSIACQVLKSSKSWLTYGRVQQAILFSLGAVIEWLISRELNEVIMIERCYKYLKDLYNVVWDKQDKLKEKVPEPTLEEKIKIKEVALQRIMDIIPSFVMMSVGPSNYRRCCKDLLHTVQYPTINRHVLYAGLEIILKELVPEVQNDYPEYVGAAKATVNS